MAEKESTAVRVAREFREQLVRNEDEALRRMSRYWVQMERSLEPQFFALAQEIKDLRDAGQPVPDQLIFSHQRYLDLMAQIMEGFRRFITGMMKYTYTPEEMAKFGEMMMGGMKK